MTGLLLEIGIVCNLSEWRLLIDSSSESLKGVLLHNGNLYLSLPLAHSVRLKEEYSSVKFLLDVLKYRWEAIGDFKMVAFLTGLQGGFIKFPCYLCLWDTGTQRHTITEGTSHNGLNLGWTGATSNRSRFWIPGKCCSLPCT